ncbi:MAG: hypothetical protein ACYC7I_05380 [Gammaproteobacteria bacterium]
MQSEVGRFRSVLEQLVAEGAVAARIADTTVSMWRDIDAVLSPIIGQRGVLALYKRSLYLARANHPGLAAVHESALQAGEFAALQTALLHQTSSNAAAASGALLQTFFDLLTNLFGKSLTERLLRSVWGNTTSGNAEMDS